MVRHVVPLDRELVARRGCFVGGEELRDAKHLFESVHVVAWCYQKVLEDPMGPARGQIDVLNVSGRLTIQNSADEKPDGFVKACLIILHLDDAALLREVVFTTLRQAVF